MNDPELENRKLRTNESSRTCLFFVPAFSLRLRQIFLATNIIANQRFIARDYKGDREGIPHIHPIP